MHSPYVPIDFELYLGDITDNYLNIISFYLHYLDSKLVDLSKEHHFRRYKALSNFKMFTYIFYEADTALKQR